MYLSAVQIGMALGRLEDVHTFFGTTFLVCKRHNLPVGSTVSIPLIQYDREFMEQYHRPYPKTDYFYRFSRTSAGSTQHWLSPKYPGGGLQKLRTQQELRHAFIHPKNTDQWGWRRNYVDVLASYLYRGIRVPAFDMAIWLYREREWAEGITANDILRMFIDEFNLTDEELEKLFDLETPENVDFQDNKITWRQLRVYIDQLPPDAPREEGGTLTFLSMHGIGPATSIEFEPASRVNLITGDNGLGKTFLLEGIWWALTGLWAGLPAYPYSPDAYISYAVSPEGAKPSLASIHYDWERQAWPERPEHQTLPGLLLYARADNSYAVWDPMRSLKGPSNAGLPEEFVFSAEEVWDGKRSVHGGRSWFVSNGLIQDWITWQNNPSRYPFDVFQNVLARLSPVELGPLAPGEPTRLPHDSREIPTISLPYGEVPILHAAAGMRRIIALAYLIVWAWNEHQTLSKLAHRAPQRQMVVLVDEIEAHLHPRWQRLIVPALLDVQDDLDDELNVQFFLTTHSPLVTASVEPRFDEDLDKLFRLDITKSTLLEGEVKLEEIPFVKHGQVDAWLTSDVFELEHARSVEAENAIEEAQKLQLEDAPSSEAVRQITSELLRYLAEDDAFWPRWIWFAEQHGVDL